MPSLFRIDRNSLTADVEKSAGVVELPGFEDMVEQNGGRPVSAVLSAPASAEAPKKAAEPVPQRRKEDMELAKKRDELAQAQKQIDGLNARAKTILDKANAQAKKMQDAAQQKGYEEGYAAASASVREQQQKDHRVLEDAVVSLRNAQGEIFSQIENSVLDLAMYVAEHIIKMKLDEDAAAFLNVVRDTLSKVRYQNGVVVNVSKAEYGRLFADQDGEIVRELRDSGVTVKQDMALKSGECLVETEFGNINSGIKTQLKRLGYALEESAAE